MLTRYNQGMSALRRFLSKCDANGDCWQWSGSVTSKGYGRFSYNGKAERAHRVSWLLHFGPIPDGMLVCHRCDNPGCVNPDHLFLGTAAENTMDMDAKGRRVNAPLTGDDHYARQDPSRVLRGEQSAPAKLTVQQVIAIRASSETQTRLARRYGITQAAVSSIIRRRTWAHVT